MVDLCYCGGSLVLKWVCMGGAECKSLCWVVMKMNTKCLGNHLSSTVPFVLSCVVVLVISVVPAMESLLDDS